jgi:hypothetical protein
VPEHQDFGFQLGPRPEEPSKSAPDQLAKVDHRPKHNRFAQAYRPDWVSDRDRVSESFLRTVDDWRRGQIDVPSRAEAIRRMVELAANMKKKPDGDC